MTNFPVCQRWLDSAHASGENALDLSMLRADPGVTGSYLAEALSGGDIASGSCTDCRACGRAFESTSALNRHLRSSLVCDRWRASKVLDKLAASAKRVADTQAVDRGRGQRWESACPDMARDVVTKAGV
jgi:hypothetical protein